MPSVRNREGRLFFDFRYRGVRCRELTTLPDTTANRRKMNTVLKRIEKDIEAGTFDYAYYFPSSPMVERFRDQTEGARPAGSLGKRAGQGSAITPLFRDFADDWKRNKAVEWRQSYRDSVELILRKHLLPTFGDLPLEAIDRQSVLDFRTALAGGGEGGGRARSPATVNRVIGILSMVMDEAAYSHGLTNPCRSLKRLRIKKTDIQPFTVDEVQLLISTVRTDYTDYLTVRFFTGLRSAEANGLKWEYVDFDRREIRIRETLVNGRTEYTKTDGSQREIHMSQPVFDALKRMETRTQAISEYVFCTRNGLPIDNHNFVARVWKPLLRHLGLKDRRPYQMRHTCATLWLAAGENPEWIARQLGHTSTQMLFQTYSRFVPNLTRQDGSAFDRMVSGVLNGGMTDKPTEPPSEGDHHHG